MGIFRPFGEDFSDTPTEACRPITQHQREQRPKPSTPDPSNFVFEKIKAVGRSTIAQVRYLDCSNYEGHKILVFHGVDTHKIRFAKKLDPHFSENKKNPTPVARFEPTKRGWDWAVKLCRLINK